MKSRLHDKFVPACYRPMIIDEWQHLRQGEGTVAEYIARFDDLMIRCNLDEEPVATLARFRAGLRPEYQCELVLQEVSTLEKAYRYTINMELFSSYTQRTHPPWIATTEVTRFVQINSAVPPPTPLPRVNQPPVPSPPPPQPFIPVQPTNPSIIPAPVTGGLLGLHMGAPTTNSGQPPPPWTNDRRKGDPSEEFDHDHLRRPRIARERESRVSSAKVGDILLPNALPLDKQHAQRALYWSKSTTKTIHHPPALTTQSRRSMKRILTSLIHLKGHGTSGMHHQGDTAVNFRRTRQSPHRSTQYDTDKRIGRKRYTVKLRESPLNIDILDIYKDWRQRDQNSDR